jgi:hypothetical protein
MRAPKITLALAIATFALSAAFANAALASPEWYAKTGGVFNKVTTALKVKATGTMKLNISTWGPTSITCKATVAGTIEAAGKGKIETYIVEGCTSNRCATITAKDVNLPWKTELYTSGTSTLQRIISGGSGNPEWSFTCIHGGLEESNKCGLNTSSFMESDIENLADVLARFTEGKSNPPTTCTLGGASSGQWTGELAIAPPAGVEAIQVK